MATDQEIHQTIIRRLLAAFRPPMDPVNDPLGYQSTIEQWYLVLNDFTVDELTVGYERFLLTWEYNGWPAPAVMRGFCHEARKEMVPQLKSYHRAPEDERTPSERQRMERQMERWRLLMAGAAPQEAYPHHPNFNANAQYDFIYDGSLGDAHRADMVAKIRKAGGA